jgi:glycosyltransferase involved in cell wall biosynthesis
MIGGPGDDPAYHDAVAERARSVPNVTHLGFVPPNEIGRYYARAFAYVNTSDLEGFPNTYLHSWARGVPTLTVEIDPDGIIARNGLGAVTGSLEGLVESAADLCSRPELRDEMSRRAIRYVREHHAITDRGDDYIRLFERLLASSSSSGSSRSG